MYVENLKTVEVKTEQEAHQLVLKGIARRQIRVTRLN